MSTNWGYRCWTCGIRSIHWFKSGEDELTALWKVRHAVGELLNTTWLDDLSGDTREAFEFVHAHADHEVALNSDRRETSSLTGAIGAGKCVHEESFGVYSSPKWCRLKHFPGECAEAPPITGADRIACARQAAEEVKKLPTWMRAGLDLVPTIEKKP